MAGTQRPAKKTSGGDAPRKIASCRSIKKTPSGAPDSAKKRPRAIHWSGALVHEEIRSYRKSAEYLIRRHPNQRHCCSIVGESNNAAEIRFQGPALAAIQEAAEYYLVC